MPENWETYKLSELTTKIGSGATPSGGKEAYQESGISLIRSQNVLDFRFSVNGLAFIDDKQAKALNNVEVETRDILLNITGDSVARVCQVPGEWLPARVNQHVAIIRANQEFLSPEYLLYYLLTKKSKDYLLTLASAGATRNALTKVMLEDFEILIPPIKEQKSIASILSALDDKIELNLQMNKTLEEMAMALYKHWFVDFGPFQNGKFVESELGMIPEGWEVKCIGDLYKTTSGGTPNRSKREYFENASISWVKSKELYETFVINTEEKISQLGLDKSSAKLIPAKSVLLAMYGATVGESSILSIEASCNQAICGIIEINTSFLYIFHYLRYHKVDVLNQATGSAQQNISQEIIKNLRIIEPEKSLSVFSELESYYNTIEHNLLENQNLTTLRDTLLPKLISGQIRVKDAEQMVAASL